MLKIGIFVIAYNAEAHIERTLARIPQAVWDEVEEVFVIDDCSTDATTKRMLGCLHTYPKLKVIRNRVNQRYGGNQKVGYQYAIDHQLDVVVMLHADGQYAPEILQTIYRPIVDGEADVVLGSRMLHREDALQGGMPKYKYFGNIVLTQIEEFLTGLYLSEYHTGYRAYRVALLRAIPFWENTNEWHFDTEILLQSYAAKARIVELPIPTYYGDEICHVNGIAYAWNCIKTCLVYFLMRHGCIYVRKFDVTLSGKIYFSKFDDPHSSHSMILRILQEHGIQNKKVLELGVGDASLTERMNAQEASITCIELDPCAASLAVPHAEHVETANVESIDYRQWENVAFDYVIAADIFEHLLQPEVLLSKLKVLLKPQGRLILSVPNIANVYTRLNLLLGRFPYHTKGILDKTHLHFYTISSAKKMIQKTGWCVKSKAVTTIPLGIVFPFLNKRAFKWILLLLAICTRIFSGLLAYQSIWVCSNPNDGELL